MARKGGRKKRTQGRRLPLSLGPSNQREKRKRGGKGIREGPCRKKREKGKKGVFHPRGRGRKKKIRRADSKKKAKRDLVIGIGKLPGG